MENTPSDIIMKAHNLLGQPVTLYLTGDEDFGGVTVRFGTLVGVDEGFAPALRINDYHDSSGRGVPRTLVEVREIIDIKAYHPGA